MILLQRRQHRRRRLARNGILVEDLVNLLGSSSGRVMTSVCSRFSSEA